MKRKPNRLIIFAAVIAFTTVIWISISTIKKSQYFDIQNNITTLNMEMTNLKKNNEELKAEINRLKTDKQYLEEVVRREYGFLKKNEIVFDFGAKKEKKSD